MNYTTGLALSIMILFSLQTTAQEEDTATLDEVVVSANKWEQQVNEVPNKITRLSKAFIIRNNPQTSADLLGQTGSVFIQKSQLGGGSPMIRGFATNRVLLVIDGVRMNNAIYRSGNLQNVISIDPLATESAEVIFGPGSLIYGSDAIGGVMDFHSLEARFSGDAKPIFKANVLARYATANKENTIHADINAGWKKWSVLSSMTYSKFDDLKMGKNGGQDSYLRPEYIERINFTDSIIKNKDPRVQKFSGYDQWNFLQKVRYKPNDNIDLQYSFTYAATGEAPRYDRLIQYRNGKLRYAEWKYGPMVWNMHILHALFSKQNKVYDKARLTAGYQDYKESRIDRTRASNTRNEQTETVDAFNLNWDAAKTFTKGELFYGAEFVFNTVGSSGKTTNISNGGTAPMVSRYPDGSNWSSTGAYGSYKINVVPKLTLTAGLRYTFNTLNATFDTTFIKFPYQQTRLRESALTGNAGLVYRTNEHFQFTGLISSGYRMPNVDDVGKLFESTPGNLTVPNPDLKPEYAWNFEIGLIGRIPSKLRVELNAFYSVLDDAITRRPFQFNGQDSVVFQGTMSKVEALQNIATATVRGIQSGIEIYFTPALTLQSNANWIGGKETDDTKNVQVALRHAPPFYGATHLRFRKNKIYADAYAMYNSEIKNKDLAPSEQAKTDIYAKDANGKPYSPGWHTLNLKTSYQLTEKLLLTAGWENITSQRYRPYSSGIVAAGSNVIVSMRAAL